MNTNIVIMDLNDYEGRQVILQVTRKNGSVVRVQERVNSFMGGNSYFLTIMAVI